MSSCSPPDQLYAASSSAAAAAIQLFSITATLNLNCSFVFFNFLHFDSTSYHTSNLNPYCKLLPLCHVPCFPKRCRPIPPPPHTLCVNSPARTLRDVSLYRSAAATFWRMRFVCYCQQQASRRIYAVRFGLFQNSTNSHDPTDRSTTCSPSTTNDATHLSFAISSGRSVGSQMRWIRDANKARFYGR